MSPKDIIAFLSLGSLRNVLNIAIYTDERAMPPLGKEATNCESGIGIAGGLAISGNVSEYFLFGINERPSPWLKGIKAARRLVSFFGVLLTHVWTRLWTP